jgi:hypothetical protein
MQGDFVIQVRPDTALDQGILRGRVEHVDSGQSARFQTVEELVTFIAQHLQAPDAEPSESR